MARFGLGLGVGHAAILVGLVEALPPVEDVVLDFTSTMPSEVTYTRAGPSTRFTVAGLADEVGTDVAPRTNRGLLLEPARTNGVKHSKTLTSDPWSILAASISPGGLAPDGTAMSRLTATATGAESGRRLIDPITTPNAVYFHSVFVRPGTSPFFRIRNLSSESQAWFNLTTMEPADTVGPVLATGVEDVGGGVFLLWFTATTGSNTSSFPNNIIDFMLSSTDGPDGASVAGHWTDVWQADVQLGDSLTSPIFATTGAVTRGEPTANVIVPDGVTDWSADFYDETSETGAGLTPGATVDLYDLIAPTGKGRLGSELSTFTFLGGGGGTPPEPDPPSGARTIYVVQAMDAQVGDTLIDLGKYDV